MHAAEPLEQGATVPTSVDEVRGPEGFASLRQEWNQLANECGAQPFLRHEFLQLWLDHFAPGARLRVLLGRNPRGALVAALPLLEEESHLCGLPVRVLNAPANSHSCRFDLLAKEPRPTAKAFLAHLELDAGWQLLRLVDVPEQGAARMLWQAAAAAGMPTGQWQSQRSPYLPLPSTEENFEAQLDKRFRSTLRRRRRRLEEKGEVRLEEICGGDELPHKLNEGLELERAGWKGRAGTAIVQSPGTLGFYSTLALLGAQLGWLRLSFLRLSGRAIAFDYALECGTSHLALKTSYDEGFANVSPGQLLTEEVVRSCIRRRLGEFDLLGDESPSKMEWTQKLRAHHWLYVFRDSAKGRLLRAAKFSLVPAAKKLLGKG